MGVPVHVWAVSIGSPVVGILCLIGLVVHWSRQQRVSTVRDIVTAEYARLRYHEAMRRVSCLHPRSRRFAYQHLAVCLAEVEAIEKSVFDDATAKEEALRAVCRMISTVVS